MSGGLVFDVQEEVCCVLSSTTMPQARRASYIADLRAPCPSAILEPWCSGTAADTLNKSRFLSGAVAIAPRSCVTKIKGKMSGHEWGTISWGIDA